jgi:hypothetical protein
MNSFWGFATHHWISITVIIGILIAVWSVFKHKQSLIYGWNKKGKD